MTSARVVPDFPLVRKSSFPPEIVELIGGGGRTRTYDLRIMRRQPSADSKGSQQDTSEKSGKVLQNPQPPRNKNEQKLEE
jgi:hypothetical protein